MMGAVARLKVKHGHEHLLRELVGTRTSMDFEGAGRVADFVMALDDHPGEYLLVVIYPDREACRVDARCLGAGRLDQRLRALLVTDPEWCGGELIDAWGVGGI
jgi:hypothetical protein